MTCHISQKSKMQGLPDRARQEELLGVCPSMAFCALPWRRESFFFSDNWGEEEDDDDDDDES